MEHRFNFNWTLENAHFREDICKVSSFPLDYDFGSQKPHYICGMSVPPIMIAQIATQVYEQWLTKINK